MARSSLATLGCAFCFALLIHPTVAPPKAAGNKPKIAGEPDPLAKQAMTAEEKAKEEQEIAAALKWIDDAGVQRVVDYTQLVYDRNLASTKAILAEIMQKALAVGDGSPETPKPINRNELASEESDMCKQDHSDKEIKDTAHPTHPMLKFVQATYQVLLSALGTSTDILKGTSGTEDLRKKNFAEAAALMAFPITAPDCSLGYGIQTLKQVATLKDPRPFMRSLDRNAAKLKVEDKLALKIAEADTGVQAKSQPQFNAIYLKICANDQLDREQEIAFTTYLAAVHRGLQRMFGEVFSLVLKEWKMRDLTRTAMVHGLGYVAIGIAANIDKCPGDKDDARKLKFRDGMQKAQASFVTRLQQIEKYKAQGESQTKGMIKQIKTEVNDWLKQVRE